MRFSVRGGAFLVREGAHQGHAALAGAGRRFWVRGDAFGCVEALPKAWIYAMKNGGVVEATDPILGW